MVSTPTDLSLPTGPAYRTSSQAGLQSSLGLEQARPTALWRLALWSGLLILTALILAYPVNWRLEPFVVRSPDIFPNLPLFGVLLYSWAAALVVLLFTAGDDSKAQWERLALVVLAALVFRGFWNTIASIQYQSMAHATDSKSWLDAGHVIQPGIYSNSPGLSLITVVLAQLTGLELLPAIMIQTLFATMVIAAAAYAFLLAVLRSSLFAALATLLVLWGNQGLEFLYLPWDLGLTFTLFFLLVLFHKRGLGNFPELLTITLLLLVALTLTHIFGALLVFFITLGLWGFGALRGGRSQAGISISILMLFLIIIFSWYLYWGTTTFASIAILAYENINHPPLLRFFKTALMTGQYQVREDVPLWYTATRLWWFTLLFAPGGLLWLWTLKRFRQMDPMETTLTAVPFGLMLAIFSYVFLVLGTFYARRPLTYGAFIFIPFLFLSLQQCQPLVKSIALRGLASLLVVLSLPSFLTNALDMPRWAYYDTEHASGQWVQSIYGKGENLNIFTSMPVTWNIAFYVPKATYNFEYDDPEYRDWSTDAGRRTVTELLDRFEQSYGSAHFIFSPKVVLFTGYRVGVPADDPLWEKLAGRLKEKNAQVYDNGVVTISAKQR